MMNVERYALEGGVSKLFLLLLEWIERLSEKIHCLFCLRCTFLACVSLLCVFFYFEQNTDQHDQSKWANTRGALAELGKRDLRNTPLFLINIPVEHQIPLYSLARQCTQRSICYRVS